MFGTNKITGKKAFEDAPPNSLKVTSIFYTIQGEGPYAGQPAMFIRLTHCNLDCSFCDAMFDVGEYMTFREIEAKMYQQITEFWNNTGEEVPEWALPRTPIAFNGLIYAPNMVLVITGGEPTIQPQLSDFIKHIRGSFGAIQIETNGLLNFEASKDITVVCSPKCSEKTGKYLKPNPDLLDTAEVLKFVVSHDPESPYHQVPEWAFEWLHESQYRKERTLYVSPMNVYNEIPQRIKLIRKEKAEQEISLEERSTVDEVVSFWTPGLFNLEVNQKNHEYAARYALTHGCKLNLQMHLFASVA